MIFPLAEAARKLAKKLREDKPADSTLEPELSELEREIEAWDKADSRMQRFIDRLKEIEY